MATKLCHVCMRYKQTDLFAKNRSTPSGRAGTCLKCVNDRQNGKVQAERERNRLLREWVR